MNLVKESIDISLLDGILFFILKSSIVLESNIYSRE